MKISELAARVGINPKTIRYYEGLGLMPEPMRLSSGYRDYRIADEERLVFIKSAQRLGLSLSVIREIMAFKDKEERPCGYVVAVLNQQLHDIDRRIGELVALRAELVTLTAKAHDFKDDGFAFCGIIEHAK